MSHSIELNGDFPISLQQYKPSFSLPSHTTFQAFVVEIPLAVCHVSIILSLSAKLLLDLHFILIQCHIAYKLLIPKQLSDKDEGGYTLMGVSKMASMDNLNRDVTREDDVTKCTNIQHLPNIMIARSSTNT